MLGEFFEGKRFCRFNTVAFATPWNKGWVRVGNRFVLGSDAAKIVSRIAALERIV